MCTSLSQGLLNRSLTSIMYTVGASAFNCGGKKGSAASLLRAFSRDEGLNDVAKQGYSGEQWELSTDGDELIAGKLGQWYTWDELAEYRECQQQRHILTIATVY